MMSAKESIAKRAAKELKDGDVVNLGIGLPTLVSNYISDLVTVILQGENGVLGIGELAKKGFEDMDCVNASAQPITVLKGGSYFDSAFSFGIIRGGHVDVAVLGALQVDEKGNLASHIVPGQKISGMGGAMDLAVGVKKVIVTTTHTAGGQPKLLKQITYPPTAIGKVDLIITELAVIKVTKDGFLLKEIASGTTVEEVIALTEASLIISDDLKIMDATEMLK